MKPEKTIGDWYEQQRAEAKRLADELARELLKVPRNHARIKQLDAALERARYVGD